MSGAFARQAPGHTRSQARDQCLAGLGRLCGAELVVLETGVEQTRWGAVDLPEARLPVVTGPTSISDASSTLRFARHPLVEAGVRSLLAAPVQLDAASSTLGTLWLASTRPGAFGPHEAQTLELFGALLAELIAPPADEVAHVAFVDALPMAAVAVVADRVSPNALACELTGYAGGRGASLDAWFTALFQDEASSARAMYDFDRAQGFHERRLVPVNRPGGGERLVEWSSRRVGVHELWLLNDITERVASQERFRVLFEQSSTALVVYDDSGVIDSNPAAVALLGHRSKAELQRLAPFQLSDATQPDGQDSATKSAAMEAIARDLGSHRFEWAYRRVDGGLAHVEVTLTALTLGAKPVLLAEWHDISERARYAEALTHARDAALKHARAKSDFLATMSHEIRTPMNGVIGMTRLLQDTSLSPQQQDYVETVRACGEGLLSLISDVLDFSKLEEGKVALEAIPFSLRELTEDVMAVVAEAAEAKGLELVSFIAPSVPAQVRGDPTRVRQVLLNLLSNAVKFTSSGAVTVRLAASREEAGQSVVTCSVRDTGVGIAHDALKRLFDAFSQEDASTTRRFGGSGLGLAICKRLVTLMGGIVDVTTSPQGSTFSLSVAFQVAAASTSARELKGRRVLLVEARALVAESMTQLLQERGAEVRLARTAGEAQLLAPGVEVVLVASQLDGGAGVGLARALHAEGRRVGLLTPLSAPAELALGVDFLVPLPARRDQLLAQVGRALSLDVVAPGRRGAALHATFTARVLVAEDNPVNQRVVKGLLSKLGCEAVVVCNGAAAVQTASEGRFELIVMDCQMPEVDGFEATRRIRAQERSRTPIVALTAGALDGDREKCLEAGMDDYLSKPVRLEDLERVLARFVGPVEKAS